jgi:hypothetical protein
VVEPVFEGVETGWTWFTRILALTLNQLWWADDGLKARRDSLDIRGAGKAVASLDLISIKYKIDQLDYIVL